MHFPNCHTHNKTDEKYEVFNAGTKLTTNHFHSIGIHPWESSNYDAHQFINQARANSSDKCIAIGEIGLDKLQGPPIEVQIRSFRPQVEYAVERDLPVLIHCVKAWEEVKALHREYKPTAPWIYHGFAKATITEEVIDEGLMISLASNIIVHPKGGEILEAIPDNKLLIETDDKEISIDKVAEHIADVKNLSLSEFNHLITTNFKNTFTKW